MVERFRIIRSVESETGAGGYSVVYNTGRSRGRKVLIGVGEPNWFPRMKDAMQYLRECERGDFYGV